MKISTRVLLANMGFFLIVLVMGGLAVYQLIMLENVANRGASLAGALRNQMQADMMHDGLRADVLYAFKISEESNPDSQKEAIDSTNEHVEIFNQSIAEVSALNISEKVNEALAQLKDPLEKYTKSAIRLTGESFINPEQAKSDYADFEKDFKYLEDAMGTFGDVIQEEFEISKLETEQETANAKFMIAGVVGLSLLLAAIGFLVMRNGVVKPLLQMAKSMTELSSGNLDIDIPAAHKKDEVGQMAKALIVFKDNAIESKRMVAEQDRIKQQAEKDKKQFMYELADRFDSQVGGSIQSLSAAAEKLQDASKEMEVTARTTQEASGSVAAASEETSANASTVASATEEMTASAHEISDQVSNVAKKASEASDSANRTSQQVNDLNTLVGNIGVVVTAIKDIAEQTNLLALNATIEAARAGEAGKGFAVVADEVKKLATETAKKTTEIENRIAEIQKATQASVEAVQNIIHNIEDIDGLSSSAAGAVEEQNAVINEITRNISEVSSAAREVAGVIGQVQQGAASTGHSAEMLRGSADEIADLSSSLASAVEGFLSQIRSDNA